MFMVFDIFVDVTKETEIIIYIGSRYLWEFVFLWIYGRENKILVKICFIY